ncbi:hypothetical protein CCAX7_24400 [Capsulimonas corticalis]|uniref:Uncharacterized protein n=1 Tax=Capsulimonas corticalis TaxID=2219043 RepID=A0A402CVF6_9BACT|nr:hypothetical protein [Capsulimonas corticalis]BDI30389.1 hypothetical protein CCAX7_24400 [Capsulimonas corticalis]
MNSTVSVTRRHEDRVIQEARTRNVSPQQLVDQLLEEGLQRLTRENNAIEARREAAQHAWEEKLRITGVRAGVTLSGEAAQRECFYED